MEINLNKGVGRNLLTNNFRYLRNNKVSFSGAGSVAVALEKKAIDGGFWKKLADKGLAEKPILLFLKDLKLFVSKLLLTPLLRLISITYHHFPLV